MAMIRVRYVTGDTDEWPVHERHDLNELFAAMSRAFMKGGLISFSTHARSGAELEYGTVWIRMKQVMMWTLDDTVDEERMASWWQPGESD